MYGIYIACVIFDREWTTTFPSAYYVFSLCGNHFTVDNPLQIHYLNLLQTKAYRSIYTIYNLHNIYIISLGDWIDNYDLAADA